MAFDLKKLITIISIKCIKLRHFLSFIIHIDDIDIDICIPFIFPIQPRYPHLRPDVSSEAVPFREMNLVGFWVPGTRLGTNYSQVLVYHPRT